jgi:hypothetical protein
MDIFDETKKAKFLAMRRAEWRLKQRLETIDFERQLKEEVEDIKSALAKGKKPKIVLELE